MEVGWEMGLLWTCLAELSKSVEDGMEGREREARVQVPWTWVPSLCSGMGSLVEGGSAGWWSHKGGTLWDIPQRRDVLEGEAERSHRED